MLAYVQRHHIALLALFVALGGTSYAVIRLPARSVGTKQLRNNAVTSAKVKNRSLKAVDFASGQLPAGATGPTGPKGDTGAIGAQGPKGDAGAAGANGSAVAYAYVNANTGHPTFDTARTKGFTSVTSPSSGTYCLAATGIDSTSHPLIVSVVDNTGFANSPMVAYNISTTDAGCPAAGWAVETKNGSPNSPTPNLDFEVVVP